MTHAVFFPLPHLVDIEKASEQIKELMVKSRRQQTKAGWMRGAWVHGCLLLDRQVGIRGSRGPAKVHLPDESPVLFWAATERHHEASRGRHGGLPCQTPA